LIVAKREMLIQHILTEDIFAKVFNESDFHRQNNVAKELYSEENWILDRYKEKTPKDPTIREKFNTYRCADYKEKVIDLLARVTRETQRIVDAMKGAAR
jgi:predicted helicase